ncbi:MAG: hypothetical protein AAB225_14775 [Acidobacteriota bacterium]
MQTLDQERYVATLRQWAEWARAYASRQTYRPDWSAVDALVEAARLRLLEDASALRELLDRSRNQLKLVDPLVYDLGVHRWLSADREESYSDWLAWVLERLKDAAAVLRLLGIEDLVSMCEGQPYRVERETGVEEGLPESAGRIDLLIHFGEPLVALVGVEVKTWDQSYEKQRGYLRSLRKYRCLVRGVLVANVEVSRRDLHGFRLRRWKEVSMAMRRAIAAYVRGSHEPAIAAMMLGFVAAIEQNLLGLGTTGARRAAKGLPTFFPQGLADYLRKTLEGDSC